jgi:ATP-dependent helicase Lhr and Lhr-like helicase
VLPEIKSTFAFRNLTASQWQWALDFISRGGDALQAYPEYQKVAIDGGIYVVQNATIARRHRMNVGTIVSDAMMEIRFGNGARLGFVEESFIARLKAGDAFTFAGRTLVLVRVKDMTAYVKAASSSNKLVPSWGGGKMPLSSELAAAVRQILQDFKTNKAQEPEVAATSRMLMVQQRVSRIPDAAELLIEQFESKEGHHIFMFPFAGRHVHTGLAALLSYRMGALQPASFSMSVNDYGLELLSVTPFVLNRALLDAVFSTDNLLDDVLKSINAAELSKRHFREVARVAGLVFQGFPGASKTNKQVQASSGLIYDVFAQWDEKNPLLAQSTREVLERELEFARLTDAMALIKTQRLTLIRCDKPTPFAFPLMLERLREKLSSEKLADRVQRMQMVWDD